MNKKIGKLITIGGIAVAVVGVVAQTIISSGGFSDDEEMDYDDNEVIEEGSTEE